MTLNENLVFDLPVWTQVSPMAKDFISKLLVKKPENRISLDKAMSHPWFANARAKYSSSKPAAKSLPI